MNKYLAVALSVMIATAGVPTFADAEVEQKTVVQEVDQTEELGFVISEALELYLEIKNEDEEAAEELSEKSTRGIQVTYERQRR